MRVIKLKTKLGFLLPGDAFKLTHIYGISTVVRLSVETGYAIKIKPGYVMFLSCRNSIDGQKFSEICALPENTIVKLIGGRSFNKLFRKQKQKVELMAANKRLETALRIMGI